MDENQVSQIVTTLLALLGGYVSITSSQQATLAAGIVIIVMAIINHFQTGTGSQATAAPAAAAAAAHAVAAISIVTPATNTPALITITGPFDGNKIPVTKTGTRLLVANNGAFQLIDDRIATNFIIASGGPNAWAPPNVWTVTNPALITWGATLY